MNNDSNQELLEMVEFIHDHLNQNGYGEKYSGIIKSLNILKSRDRNGYHKVSDHLLDDFRRLYDNRHDSELLNEKFDAACKLAEKLF
ncbi:hypothetical protein [Polycladidibacter stylochi]|uniref:hypothetical protein n=1 Tax=Polycladidibacter stylochi TaxID=1807766 RepID=UPI0008356237|nr:hypothetical protein [Pseudovibrio stylochi]